MVELMSKWVEDSHLTRRFFSDLLFPSDKDGKLGAYSHIFMAYRERQQHGPESCGLEMRFLVS